MNSPRISIIAIISKNRGLGKDNALLFHIPGELPRFKKITMGHPIIMGRKTFESIGKPLAGRLNIVISRSIVHNLSATFPHCVFVTSLEIALEEAKRNDQDEIFIIGGGQIYEQALPFANRLYLTVVDAQVDADTFFPAYPEFTKVIPQEDQEDHATEKYTYSFLCLEREEGFAKKNE